MKVIIYNGEFGLVITSPTAESYIPSILETTPTPNKVVEASSLPQNASEYDLVNNELVLNVERSKVYKLTALKAEYDIKLKDYADAYAKADLLGMDTGLIKVDAQECYQEYITKKEIIENE